MSINYLGRVLQTVVVLKGWSWNWLCLRLVRFTNYVGLGLGMLHFADSSLPHFQDLPIRPKPHKCLGLRAILRASGPKSETWQ